MISVADMRVDATVFKAAAMLLYIVGFALGIFYGIDALRLSVLFCVALAAVALHFWPTREPADWLTRCVAAGLVLAFVLDAASTWVVERSGEAGAMCAVCPVAWFLSVAGILAFPRRLLDRSEVEQ